jgi:hypothetical protein
MTDTPVPGAESELSAALRPGRGRLQPGSGDPQQPRATAATIIGDLVFRDAQRIPAARGEDHAKRAANSSD